MLGLYVHIPFCVSKCAYCDFYSLPGRREVIDQYVQSVLTEAAFYRHSGAVRFPINSKDDDEIGRAFQTLYIGGGTPSLLGVKNLNDLITGLRDKLNLDKLVEATTEVNPDSASLEFLKAAKTCGIDRLSIGVQSLNDSELQSVGRVHTSKQAITAIKLARKMGFKSISADIIVGLPGQTQATLEYTLETLIALGVNHVSMYCLSVEENTPLARSLPENLPPDDAQADLFMKARSLLTGRGFIHYEISNFAQPGHECIHNLNYWRGGEYLGLGPAAASHLHGKRFRNKADLDAYLADPTGQIEYVEELDEIDKIAEEAMLRLRLPVEGIDTTELHDRYTRAAVDTLTQRLDELAARGFLVKSSPNRYTIPADLLLTSNRILREVVDLRDEPPPRQL